MNKAPIGIIDMSVEGLYILNALTKEFKYEDFVYINDLKNAPYEGRDEEEIVKLVSNNVNILFEKNIKLLVVISDSIIEYASEYLSSLSIPVINIVQSIINYTNSKHEQKNIILVAKDYILKANLYQKNFKYNHLYTIDSKNLDDLIAENKIKTSKSFATTQDTFKSILNKESDALIYTSPWIEMLKTEILEYVDVDEIAKLGSIIVNEIKKENIEFYQRGKGKITLISNINKEDFVPLIKWFDLKYKYMEVLYEQD